MMPAAVLPRNLPEYRWVYSWIRSADLWDDPTRAQPRRKVGVAPTRRFGYGGIEMPEGPATLFQRALSDRWPVGRKRNRMKVQREES